jgi:uncharacterized protein
MGARTDTFDLASLSLQAGQGRRLDLEVQLEPIVFGSDEYVVEPPRQAVHVDVARMVGGGWSLRLRFSAALQGPCMRCLAGAQPVFEVDAREIDQAGAGDELDSPYVTGDLLDIQAWAHDAFALALPGQILCRPECLGLCAICGANLNEDPAHEHPREPDPRWAALRDLKLD